MSAERAERLVVFTMRFLALSFAVVGILFIVTPNGVQESFVATLGGARQAVSVRGADRAKQVERIATEVLPVLRAM